MKRSDDDNFIDPSEFSVDRILAEYDSSGDFGDGYEDSAEQESETYSISMEDSGSASSAYISDPVPDTDSGFRLSGYEGKSGTVAGDESADEFDAEHRKYDSTYSDEDTDEYADYDYPDIKDEWDDSGKSGKKGKSEKRAGFDFIQPVIAMLAAMMLRRQQRAAAEENEDEEDDVPEPTPAKASKFYASQAKPFKFRGRIAAILCLPLIYISYGYGHFPMASAIMDNIKVAALVCLLLELAVILTGLDIFTNGITTLLNGKPRAESLVSVSCLLSVLDAVIIAITGNASVGLPFCAVSALSVAFSIWGSRLMCDGLRSTFRTAAAASSPYIMTAEREVSEDGSVIIKSDRGIEGFIKRSEEADATEAAYATATPILLVSALVLSILAGIRSGNFFHCLSALTAVIAPFSALLSFSMPFRIVAGRLYSSGAAIAGWSGASDIGKSKYTVITDTDIFPAGTISIGTIRILEGTFTDKVISYTGSMLIAANCSLTPAFSELMNRNSCAIHPVDDFECHEGGGIIGMVRGEQVYVGTSGFMNLMGIRLPQSQIAKDTVFTAIGGTLVGTFAPNYMPTASVQDALVSMLHNRGNSPLFAIRDLNITPLLIKQKFRMPTESFDFPSVSERYRISSTPASQDSPPCAIIAREGLGPMVEAATGGRNIYRSARLLTAISILGAAAGMILMFLLCWTGSFDSAGVTNIMSFMFLWLVPALVIAGGLRR